MKRAHIRLVAILIVLILRLPQSGLAQHIEVCNQLGQPIAGAHIRSGKGASLRGAITDPRGKAQLALSTGDTLHISALGFADTTALFVPGVLRIALRERSFALGEVVITAQYQPTPATEAVHKVQTIQAEEIRKRAAVNLGDVLRNELNFRVSQDAVLGSGASLMGISGENVKIMVDGVPVIGRLNGNIDLSQINLAEAERIEIVEGPLAVNYGTNAMAGTINIITRTPGDTTISGGGTLFTESSGHYNASAWASAGKGNHSLRVNGARNYFDGWHPGDKALFHSRSMRADTTRVQQWKPREQYSAGAKYRYAPASGNYVEVAGNLFLEEIVNRGRPDRLYGETAFDDRYLTRRSDVSVKFQSDPAKPWKTHILAAYNHYQRTKNTYVTDLTGIESTLSEDRALQDTTVFETTMSRGSAFRSFSRKLTFQAGYEVEREAATGERIPSGEDPILNAALFTTAQWKPMAQLTIKGGLRYGYNSRYAHPLIPSLNVLANLTDKIQVRASYAHGFRAPGLKELAFYFVDINHNILGNPDLQAENGRHINAWIQYCTGPNKRWQFSAGGFTNSISNLITLGQINDVEYTYLNIGEAKTRGVQGKAGYRHGRWNVSAGAVLTGISNRIDAGNEIPAFNTFPEINGAVQYTAGYLSASLFWKHTGRRNFFVVNADGQPEESFVAAWQSADASVSYGFMKDRITLGAGARNLFNVTNIATGVAAGGGVHGGGGTSQPVATGRTYFLQLTANF